MESTRRDFLKQMALAGVALSTHTFEGMAAPVKSKPSTAVGKLKVGIIGVNSRGMAIAGTMATMDTIDIVCLCDCDKHALQKCQDWVEKTGKPRPQGEQDIRKMVKRDDLEAIVVATPDHWHATAAIMALNAGKHVYLEKPTSYCPEENEMLLQAERKYGKVVQVGMQRRSYPAVRQAMQELHDGVIGEVHYAKSWYTNKRGSIGKGKPVSVPENLNWDFWQGPAPRGPQYKDNLLHYNWHWHWHWGTGEALNNGTHFVDLLRWGLQIDEYPSLVTSVGGRYHFCDDDWETPDTQMITFQFGNKASFSWEGRSCDPSKVNGSSSGVMFYGEQGKTLSLTGGNEYVIKDGSGNIIKQVDSAMSFRDGDLFNPSANLDIIHFQNWVDAIRRGTPLNDPLNEACMSTQYVQYGNIAQRLGTSLRIDPVSGRILTCPQARKLWRRKYDADWSPKQFL